MRAEHVLFDAGFPVYLHGFSAIDSYLTAHGWLFSHELSDTINILCMADLADLARLFDELRYPGAALADAALDCGETTWYFRCVESGSALRDYRSSLSFLEFFQDCKTRRFFDPNDLYPYLRYLKSYTSAASGASGKKHSDTAFLHSFAIDKIQTMHAGVDPNRALLEGAIIISRYFPEINNKVINGFAANFNQTSRVSPVSIEEQKLALLGLLQADNPAAGFELLKKCGFISAHWPELAVLDDVDHSKEYHPEGNVWKHTMEALRYRKSGSGGYDLRLSLGLLLHDVGKPLSNAAGSHRFDGHAELGEHRARRFLERLGFNAALVRDVCYLVRNHMLPAALPRLPLSRTEEIMASPLFPLLMELYRCDESSSFKGLDGYYQSSAAYQTYLKNRRNPYRSADGKKLKREQMYRQG